MKYLFERKAWLIGAGLLALAGMQSAAAQTYPSKPIKLVVPYPPGGGVDIAARALQGRIQKTAPGYSIIVDNRGGAGGAIGTDGVAKGPADGYSLLMASPGPLTLLPVVRPSVGYSTRDFAPVSLVASAPHLIVVNPSLPVRDIRELVQYAKTQPNGLAFGSPGAGSVHHLAGEMFRSATGVKVLQVPYKGSGQMLPDLVSGQLQFTSLEMNTALPYLRTGTLRALAVAAKTRNPALPDLPTMAELGYPDFEVTAWFGVVAPAKTPGPIVAQLAEKLRELRNDPGFKESMEKLGVNPILSTPEEFQTHIDRESAKWEGVAKASGIKLDKLE
jgi:tripartite-type tricarboxylate transporter receptor subunit TctC